MNAGNKPMTHPDENRLAAFAERALRGAERATVAEHLANCARCREIVFLSQEALQAQVVAHPNPVRWSWQTVAVAASGLALLAAVLLTREGIRFSFPGGEHGIAQFAPPKVSNATGSAPKLSSAAQLGVTPNQSGIGVGSKAEPRRTQERRSSEEVSTSRSTPVRRASKDRTVPATPQALSAGAQPASPPALPVLTGVKPSLEAFDSRRFSASLVSLPAVQNSIPRFAVVNGNVERWDNGGFQILPLPNGERAEAVSSNSRVVLVLSRGRKLYRSVDLGERWAPVLVQWNGTAAKLDVKSAGLPSATDQPFLGNGPTSAAAASASISSPATARAYNSHPAVPREVPSFNGGVAPSDTSFVLTNGAGKRWISEDGGQTWRPE